MKEIKLSQNKIALVDDTDFEWLNQWKWCINAAGYAIRATGPKNDRTIVFMHKQVMDNPNSMVDHKDRNKLNNQRLNLRLCTNQQNLWNCGLRSTNTSGLKGVSYKKKSGKWFASLRVPEAGGHKRIGTFNSKEEAARAYDKCVIDLRGDFAVLNVDLA